MLCTPQKQKPREPMEYTPEKVVQQTAIVQQIKSEHAPAFKKLAGMRLVSGYKHTHKGWVPSQIAACCLCGRRKHSCSWQYRFARKTRLVTGGTCLCCVKATKVLKVTRSVHVLQELGLKPAVVKMSEFLQEKRGSSDTCSCDLCKGS